MKKLLVGLFFWAWTSSVFALATQSATLDCVSVSKEGQGCDKYHLVVRFLMDKEIGMQGVTGVVAMSAGKDKIAYWTEQDGWRPYNAGDEVLIKPVKPGLRKLSAIYEYEVFTGSRKGLCDMSRGKSFNIYAWYMVLSKAEIAKHEKVVNEFEITGLQAENFWNSILFSSSAIQNKASMVYSVECSNR